MTFRPKIGYASSGDVSIAYGVAGDGPMDIVLIPGFISHAELILENRHFARDIERLSRFARVVWFDKRGTGLSDPVDQVPSLEVRMDDVRAVMDAVGIERAALIGFSEGAALAILFAAAAPERTESLILVGGMARSTWAPDYPWATPKEDLLESIALIRPYMNEGALNEIFAPSLDDPAILEWNERYERAATSPGMLAKVFLMFLDIDVRAVLPSVHVPTLVLHKRGDRVVNRRAGMYLAEQIEGARYVELPGIDHAMWATDNSLVVDYIEEFLTGVTPVHEPNRVLATVLFTDIVDSTTRAASIGDAEWRALIERHHAIVRDSLAKHRGREVKTMGDGFLATFDGPGRAISSARAIIDAVRAIGLEVRAGLHTGEIEIMGEDIGGIAVTTASRVCDEAGGGEVLVSQTVKDLVVGSNLAFDDRGAHALKGVPGEWRLFTALP